MRCGCVAPGPALFTVWTKGEQSSIIWAVILRGALNKEH